MFVVRDVTMEDAGRILEIYDHYVRNTAITFEYETNSANFHAHLGFAEVGRFHKCGYKFGRWYDMIWREKVIGVHKAGQPSIIPYSELGTK